jgi:predicted AAA+ superfamily ATPase
MIFCGFICHKDIASLSLDDLHFSGNSFVDFAGEFVKRGGKYLFLDEVHKYKNWSQEIKSTYDYFPELKMVLTGSSAPITSILKKINSNLIYALAQQNANTGNIRETFFFTTS